MPWAYSVSHCYTGDFPDSACWGEKRGRSIHVSGRVPMGDLNVLIVRQAISPPRSHMCVSIHLICPGLIHVHVIMLWVSL